MKKPEEIKKGLEYVAETNVTRKIDLIRAGIVYQFTEDLAADALAYIQQLEAQVPQWISVEERLPSISGKYIVCTEKGSVYSTGFRVYGESGHFQTDINTHITHWMPLPVPPEEEV